MQCNRYRSTAAAAVHCMAVAARRARRVSSVAVELGRASAALVLAVAMDAVLIGVPALGLIAVLSMFF